MSHRSPTSEAVLEYLESMIERLEQWVKDRRGR